MRMSDESTLDDLLVQWGEARERGQHLTAEALCADHPELVADLTERIKGVEFVRPFIDIENDSADDLLHLPDFSTISNRSDDTRLPQSGISLDEFCQRIVESGLMTNEDVEKLRKDNASSDAVSFATQLIADKKLTRFQATVLLEGRDLPLVLDRYVILEELGEGGMGAVYKALHQQMDRIVALKILPKSAVDSVEKVKRFQQEVKAAAKLEHPNIVTAFDAHESKGTHFLVMSYEDGQDLAKLVRYGGPVSVAKAVHYIAQAARGLEHAHDLGIVHRDIKPANLLLDKKGAVKIFDMGLARSKNAEDDHEQAASTDLTHEGMVMGTIAYLPPEQALDTRNADARSDMYSLGCTLFYLLTGNAPYQDNTMMKTIVAHREGAIPSLSSMREGVPAEVDAIFQKMIAKKPDDRFQSMTELLSALEELDIEDDESQQPVDAGSEPLHNTVPLIDTSRECRQPTKIVSGKKELPKRLWPIVAISLAGIVGAVGAASIFLKVETAAGTIILEIDQPELAGAEVAVDGQKRITIKTGEGAEPIQVEADEKTHTLKVTKGGFEAFFTTFTVKPGKERAIKVRLEPVKADNDQAIMPPTVGNWALEFDGANSMVQLPLTYNGAHPLTIDVTVKQNRDADRNRCRILGNFSGRWSPVWKDNTEAGLELQSRVLPERGRVWAFWMSAATPQLQLDFLGSNQAPPPDNHAHLSVVVDSGAARFYYNGTLAGTKLYQTHRLVSDAPFQIGTYFPGLVDEVRFSKIARYTEDFTPKVRLESDEDTLALYHFDEGHGDVLKDSSGNGHHGKIVRAKWFRVDNELNVIK
jgi:serine/threonine protein kinase